MAEAMLSLAINHAARFPSRMSETISAGAAERRILGKALASLRRSLGLTQAKAAELAGITTQGWQKREAGDWRFTEPQLEEVTAQLGSTVEALLAERAKLLGHEARAASHAQALEIPGRGVSEPFDLRWLRNPSIGVLRIAGDAMAPWAEPGEIVIYDRDRWPKRGAGCVIETRDGQLHVRIYERSDDSHVYVRHVEPGRSDAFALSGVKGVFAIRLRGD